VSGFCCRGDVGSYDLEDFIKNDAMRLQEKDLSRVYLAYQGENLVGYFALCCYTIKLQQGRTADEKAAEAAQLGDDARLGIPGVLLGRLAVDERCQGRGIGKELFSWALRIARRYVAPMLGCRFLFIDAYAHKAYFYARRGCQPIGKQREGAATMQMYIDLFPPTTAPLPFEE